LRSASEVGKIKENSEFFVYQQLASCHPRVA
jgi:hypothetical protein